MADFGNSTNHLLDSDATSSVGNSDGTNFNTSINPNHNNVNNISNNNNVEKPKSSKDDFVPINYAQTDSVITSADELRTKRNFYNQFNALFRKSATYQWRQYKTNLCQIILPLLLILLLFILQVVVDNFIKDQEGYKTPEDLHPQPYLPAFYQSNETALEECKESIGVYPRSLVYIDSSDQSFIPDMTANITAYADQRIVFLIFAVSFVGRYATYCQYSPSIINPLTLNNVSDSIVTFNDLTYNEWKTNPYIGGYNFKNVDSNNFELSLLYNNSNSFGKELPTLLHLASRAYLSMVSTNPIKVWFDGIADFPREEKLLAFDLVSILGPILYIFIFQLPLPVVLRLVLYEKEKKLREIMKMMGLEMKTYWLVTYIFSYSIYLISMMLVWLFGSIFQFKYFLMNNGLPIFLIIFFWGHLLVSFAFFLSVFFSKTEVGTVIGYIWVFGTGILAGNVILKILDSPSTPDSSLFAISIVPPFVLFRALYIFRREVTFDGVGVKISTMSDSRNEIDEIIGFMIVEAIIFMVLALYLEEVLPSDYGVKRHPLFFLKKSFWTGERDESMTNEVQLKENVQGEPRDVRDERRRIKEVDQLLALEILDLNKVYPAHGGAKEKLAVKSLALGVDQGICFGFLGTNGSGKSTTVSCISGLFPPTSGTARIFGLDIRTEIDKIHMIMGITPQDNVLWDDLTGEEHLLFFGRIKNLKGQELTDAVNRGLKEVNLHEENSKRSGQYSGGMKRRLSVACGLIGDPKIVLLDEPSTGLDPFSRACLWDVINSYKRKCAILLVSHAMEEVEALCQRVGIFINGELKCIGGCSELVSRFSKGYKIMINAEQGYEQEAQKYLMDLIPQATLLTSIAGTSNYEVPHGSIEMSNIFSAFEENKERLHITDWGISNSSLEEVFIKVALGRQGDDGEFIVDEPVTISNINN
ncbi:ABC transporter A family protein [Tieghemostelium lacteum]|uniref:ABC transporter A family protein n=1 Tax=Tieghemostelium lacteum TaxID=361077 RepID=A0A152A9L2_TIELA|nr:ABC transporter A family protein [Tieghemostelium lacteum]|eukprot:KYR02910.1 ABC transporter A family protein [Tieghemostelium lacteum]